MIGVWKIWIANKWRRTCIIRMHGFDADKHPCLPHRVQVHLALRHNTQSNPKNSNQLISNSFRFWKKKTKKIELCKQGCLSLWGSLLDLGLKANFVASRELHKRTRWPNQVWVVGDFHRDKLLINYFSFCLLFATVLFKGFNDSRSRRLSSFWNVDSIGDSLAGWKRWYTIGSVTEALTGVWHEI